MWKGTVPIFLIHFFNNVGLQIVLRDQKSKEGFKYQSVEIYWSEQRAGLSSDQSLTEKQQPKAFSQDIYKICPRGSSFHWLS